MAGHSKFANIKHKKAKNDAAKGRIFTRLGREIAVAVKSGGADPLVNGRLKDVIAKAKSENMPNDTIDRSIKKAAGDIDNISYESIVYEGYGPNGVAVIVETLTDNKNRTAANVRSAFTKGGGNMGTTGCVSFLFKQLGQIMVENSDGINEEELMMSALEAGADDFLAEEEGFVITTSPDDFSTVREMLEENGISMVSAGIVMQPQTKAVLTDADDIKKMNKLLDLLDEDDDVQNVYTNWDEE